MSVWDLIASEEFQRLVTIIPPTYGSQPSPAKITPSVHDTMLSLGLIKHKIQNNEPSPVEKPKQAPVRKEFLTIPEIAERWRIARPTVYNRLRSAGLRVLDFAPKGGRGRKVVPLGAVLEIERKQLKRV